MASPIIRFRTELFLVSLCLCVSLLSSCSSAGGGPPPPDGWKTAGNPRAFTFNLPDDFVEQELKPIDSWVGSFKTATTEIGFDYGMYSDPLDQAEKGETERTVDSVIVEGWPARMVRSRRPEDKTWTHAIHVWGWDKENHTSLTLWITSTAPLSTSFTNTVFASIHLAASSR